MLKGSNGGYLRYWDLRKNSYLLALMLQTLTLEEYSFYDPLPSVHLSYLPLQFLQLQHCLQQFFDLSEHL